MNQDSQANQFTNGQGMKSFLWKTLLMFMPFFYLLLVYVYMDPFKVIYRYDNFFEHTGEGYINLNKDYVSTTNFVRNYENEKYNAFIFGNSRSIFYHVDEWKKFIGDSSRCYHFDASGESLYAIYRKVLFLDRKQVEIKNVLMILDYETLEQDKPRRGHLYVTSPLLTNYRNVILFHAENFMAFLSPNFLYAYLDYRFSGKVKEYMKESFLLLDIPVKYDRKSNEMQFPLNDEKIAKGVYYTPELISKEFYHRDSIQHYYEPAIREKQMEMLREIQSVFQKQHTQCKIIINPMYNQKKLNSKDLNYLNQVFGKENVFDFSGINSITSDYKNYYEKSHYRPKVADDIMKEIYNRK